MAAIDLEQSVFSPSNVRPLFEFSARLLDFLPFGIYACGRTGVVTNYNRSMVQIWGYAPQIGEKTFFYCGSNKILDTEGNNIPHSESPMAVALRTGQGVRNKRLIVERHDGGRVFVEVNIEPIRDEVSEVVGAVSIVRQIDGKIQTWSKSTDPAVTSTQSEAERAAYRLAAIVESSGDAIVAKTLDGIITDWNEGAKNLYGYAPEEVIGKSVTILFPDNIQGEEDRILESVRRGEPFRHYETVRRRKDGSLVDISLSVSPIKDAHGVVIGASAIAHDITEEKLAKQRLELLLREMDHRVKNLFALSNGIVSLSARTAETKQELVSAVGERLDALARAHSLTMKKRGTGDVAFVAKTTLHTLIRTIVAPYENTGGDFAVKISGVDPQVEGSAITNFALLLHEFTSNAAKYGALSVPGGAISITFAEQGDHYLMDWVETGGPRVSAQHDEGFGTLIGRATVEGQLNGEITYDWHPDGLRIHLSIARNRLT